MSLGVGRPLGHKVSFLVNVAVNLLHRLVDLICQL